MSVVARQPVTPALEPEDDAFDDVARAMVAAGRVVPGLTVEADGRGRSWWWPLPAASHRSLVAGLVTDPSVDGQRRAADRLATAGASGWRSTRPEWERSRGGVPCAEARGRARRR